MKYPKLWDGASPVGESGIRALDKVDAPYLTSVGPDSISYKKNGFNEIHLTPQTTGEPYLWGTYVIANAAFPGGIVKTAVFSPEDGMARTMEYRYTYILGPEPNNIDGGRVKVFVGDNYILRTLCNQSNTIALDAVFWPSIVRAVKLGVEYLSGQADHERHTISYIDTIQFTGLGELGQSVRLAATGWDGETNRYRYCVMGNVNPVIVSGLITSADPVCFVGSTGTYELVQAPFPRYTGRYHFTFGVFAVGPGKLRTLQCVAGKSIGTIPTLTFDIPPPFIAASSDHGLTWSASSPSWLTALMMPTTASDFSLSLYNAQSFAMSRSSMSAYIGNGKSILYIGNAYENEVFGTSKFKRRLYLEDGGSYTRLSWPPDDWPAVDGSGYPPGLVGVGFHLGLEFPTDVSTMHFGFGVGCIYFIMIEDYVPKILYTRDFGSTWTISPAAPVGVRFRPGVMVKPYIDESKPGRIVFPAPDYEGNKLRFYSTDGNFTEWKLIGNLVKTKGDLIENDYHNSYFVNYGGTRYRPQVFPAYPDEFMEPRT